MRVLPSGNWRFLRSLSSVSYFGSHSLPRCLLLFSGARLGMLVASYHSPSPNTRFLMGGNVDGICYSTSPFSTHRLFLDLRISDFPRSVGRFYHRIWSFHINIYPFSPLNIPVESLHLVVLTLTPDTFFLSPQVKLRVQSPNPLVYPPLRFYSCDLLLGAKHPFHPSGMTCTVRIPQTPVVSSRRKTPRPDVKISRSKGQAPRL